MKKLLAAEVMKTGQLSKDLTATMYEIFSRYYDEVSFELFKDDLSKKHYAVLLFSNEEQKTLEGFTTVAVQDLEFDGRPIRVIFSGDTIIDRSFWGQVTLPFAWCRLAGQLKAEAPDRPLYWLLIVKGHRTYRLMTLFAKEHYPTWRQETPAKTSQLMDFLGRSYFGSAYHAATGRVVFPKSRGQLKPEFGAIEEGRAEKADVRFFLEKNPAYFRGEELLCLTELCPENMRSFARSGFLEGYRS